LLNRNVAAPDRTGRMELDDIALLLARFSNRSETTLESLYAPQGRLILAPLANAPFPHPARAEGHVYKEQLFSAADHYSDSTVAVFVPKGFRETESVNFVVYFHGWRNSVVGTLSSANLIEQFGASRQNTLLVVPAGPLNAPDSFGGKLEDSGGFTRFMDDVVATLRKHRVLSSAETRVGDIILSGHSGGYRVMSAVLERGGLTPQVKEVWLFDALYGGTEAFLAWQTNQNGRLLAVYTKDGGTLDETQRAMRLLQECAVDYCTSADDILTRPELLTHRVVFVETDLAHGEVVAKGGLFARFLETSDVGKR
jgi:hypothetical protein